MPLRYSKFWSVSVSVQVQVLRYFFQLVQTALLQELLEEECGKCKGFHSWRWDQNATTVIHTDLVVQQNVGQGEFWDPAKFPSTPEGAGQPANVGHQSFTAQSTCNKNPPPSAKQGSSDSVTSVHMAVFAVQSNHTQ